MPERFPVSVCMISGAEAGRIGKALESVASWAGEIVVLLNASAQDGTEEIARKHGAKVFREPWKGFIGQKNSAAEKATLPWLLNLDADEVIPPALAEEIRQVVSCDNKSKTAYEFPRCTFYCGRWIRHGDWYPDRVLRLWRKDSARWGGEEPHARLEVSGAVGRLRSDLLHFTNQSIGPHVQKIISYGDDFVRHQAGAGRAGSIDLFFRPCWRFVRAYFLRLGFLDGWQGYYIAWASAFAVTTKYALLKELEQKRTAPPPNPARP